MYKLLRQLVKADTGGSAAEYGLVASVIAIMLISGILLVGGSVGSYFNYIASEVNKALSTSSFLK